MTDETRAVLHAALATDDFAGVRAALEEEARLARQTVERAQRFHDPAERWWRNNRWQAA